MKTLRTLTLLALMALAFTITPVLASEGDIESALQNIGVVDPQATINTNDILITGGEIYPKNSPWDAVLHRFASVIATAADAADDNLPITLEVTFDDGNIMRITGDGQKAQKLQDGDLSIEEYEQALIFTPVTRGPILVPGICNVNQGNTCADTEACGCYANETCTPGDSTANDRGCVVTAIPGNAFRENGHYACNAGYVWNESGTTCERPLACPSGEVAFQGACYASSSENDTPVFDGGESPSNRPNVLLLIFGGLFCLLIPVAIIVAVVLIRRRKKNAQSIQTPVQPSQTYRAASQPVPTPPPTRSPAPVLDPRFRQLEQRYHDLTRAYHDKRIDQPTFYQHAQQLVIQDSRGHWSFSAGQWLWYNGTQWIPRDPRI